MFIWVVPVGFKKKRRALPTEPHRTRWWDRGSIIEILLWSLFYYRNVFPFCIFHFHFTCNLANSSLYVTLFLDFDVPVFYCCVTAERGDIVALGCWAAEGESPQRRRRRTHYQDSDGIWRRHHCCNQRGMAQGTVWYHDLYLCICVSTIAIAFD